MHRCEVEGLDPTRTWWVAAVVSPRRDWAGAPGCRRGARFMVDGDTLSASRNEFEAFGSRLDCLSWIMRHRARLEQTLPDAGIRAVPLDRWLLGLE
jgi:hypothetical protein